MKLIIFGDSFASDQLNDPAGKSWHRVLGHKLNIEEKNYINYSRTGSSIEYSITAFFKYMSTNTYHKDDIIVFVMTSLNRSPLLIKGFPPEFASEMTRHLDGTLSKEHPAYNHYTEYNDFYKTLFEFRNIELIWAHRLNLLMTLKHLPNTVISLSGFKNIEYQFKVGKLIESTDTFLNFKPNLFDISNDELVSGTFYDFHAFFKGECRNCHLSRTNNLILGEQLYECIVNKSIEQFDITKFKKNFISLNNSDVEQFNSELGPGHKRYLIPNVKLNIT
jgi:hypothetical protein